MWQRGTPFFILVHVAFCAENFVPENVRFSVVTNDEDRSEGNSTAKLCGAKKPEFKTGLRDPIWMVDLYRRFLFKDGNWSIGCGGTVLTKRWILTTASCVYQNKPQHPMEFVVDSDGPSTITDDGSSTIEGEYRAYLTYLYPHFTWDKIADNHKQTGPQHWPSNNIAMVKLKKPGLNIESVVSNGNGLCTLRSHNGGKPRDCITAHRESNKLVQESVSIATDAEIADGKCNIAATSDTSSHSTMEGTVCPDNLAGDVASKSEDCGRDSDIGYPVVCNYNGSWTLYGITTAICSRKNAVSKMQHLDFAFKAAGVLLDWTLDVQKGLRCPDGWTMYQDKCYYINFMTNKGTNTKLVFSAAKEFCKVRESDLVQITSEGENSYLSTKIQQFRKNHSISANTKFWTAGKINRIWGGENGYGFKYVWESELSDVNMNYNNFADKEPTHRETYNTRIVLMAEKDRQDVLWVDDHPDSLNNFICEMRLNRHADRDDTTGTIKDKARKITSPENPERHNTPVPSGVGIPSSAPVAVVVRVAAAAIWFSSYLYGRRCSTQLA